MTAFLPAILSASLGRAQLHDFETKIKEAGQQGFRGIEIFYEDLEIVAKKRSNHEIPTADDLCEAARQVHSLCHVAGLQIIGLQPFLFYEGLVDRQKHDELIEKIHVWFRIVKELDTATIQIPANFLPPSQLTGDLEVIVGDLRKLADLGLQENPQVRFAYENLCWSTHVDTWEKAWEVVRQVDRPNFGLCLDTFNIAGRVWADPTALNGKTSNADEDLKQSISRLVKDVDLNKVFYIQVVDAERMASPLVKGHPFYTSGQPPRMSWSRNARAFAYEEDRGAYLPVEDVARAIIHDMGYKGFVSMELFSRTMSEAGEHVPAEHARRGMASWAKLVERLDLK
ncbi:xylose isomerase-like protein [Phaeosphaeriaceae sp. SRC1lsM3a]|nr:xylose isomerase-like protein [Stagonospora sp. SRC1lsM3a]